MAVLHDAYLPWADATQRLQADPTGGTSAGGWIWLLIALKRGNNVRMFSQAAASLGSSWVRVPEHYLKPPVRLERAACCTALVSEKFLAALRSDRAAKESPALSLCQMIARYEIGYPMKPWSEKPVTRRSDALPTGSNTVVIGVIDDGLAFANQRFCSIDNSGKRRTRFVSLWNQDGPPHGKSPGLYGCCLRTAELDACLARGQLANTGLYDEDAVYAEANAAAVRRRITHGTHVLDLACGADPDAAAAAPWIVGVQPPSAVLDNTSGASSAAFLLDAVWHVLAEADRAVGKPRAKVKMPGAAVINLSMGNIAGPHNGSSIFETALNEVIAARRGDPKSPDLCHIVLPTGNSKLARCHAWVDLEAGATVSLAWQVQPGDGTPSFVELWFCDAHAASKPVKIDRVSLVITQPNGLALAPVRVGKEVSLRDALGRTVGLFSLRRHVANGNLGMGLLALAPTAPLGSEPAAAAGTWTIEIHNGHTRPMVCNLYVQRDDVPFGRRGSGRQSVLMDGYYRRFDARGALEERDLPGSFVRRAGTLNGLAGGAEIRLATGTLTDPDGRQVAARYASDPQGAPRAAGSPTPVAAVTEDSRVLHGVLASGTRSGSVVALSGTSMAAPQLTRELARRYVERHTSNPRVQSVAEAQDLAARSKRRRGQ